MAPIIVAPAGNATLAGCTVSVYLSAMRPESRRQLGHGGKWDSAGVLLDESLATAPMDLPGLFGNNRPVEVEIGTGKGTFLLARAAARPEVNFIGIEWANAYCTYTADRIRRAGLSNVRMLRADAGQRIETCIADQALQRLHVYFPDPWPKRKHQRRRLIQPGFLKQARRILRLGGQLLIVTDHLGYFCHIQHVLACAEGFAKVPWPQMCDEDGQIVGTNFERKYIAQGRPFYRAARLRYT